MPDENTPTAELLLIMLQNEGNIWRSLEVKSSLITGTLLHNPFQRFSGWSRNLTSEPGMPRLIWSLTLGNHVTLLLPQFGYSVSHPDSHRALRALWGLSMTSWSTIHKKVLWLVVWTQRNWWCGNCWVWVMGCCGRGCVELRICCGSHRAWVRSQQALSPGINAAQSCCLLCLMGEVQEWDCLKGQCSPSVDSQVCVEWGWDQKYGRTISHSAGSCGFLRSVIQDTNLG